MSYRYRVSIPVEPVIQDGVELSISHKLDQGLALGDILRVRVEDTITYLDIEVAAEQRNEAITAALSVAWRLVQLISLVYNKGFEVSLAGIQAIPIAPVEPAFEIREEENHVHLIFRETLHISDHLRITENISTFEPLLQLWERINQSNNVAADGLEWLYLGKIASNDRTAFLAHWIALELLVEHTPGNERATTVLQYYVPAEKRALLKAEMEQVLKKYIEDDTARARLIKYLEQAKLESDIDRWTRILKESGVDVHPGEVQQFVRTRGAIVHSSNKSNTVVPSPRLREVVTTYLNVLLRSVEEEEILSGPDPSS